MHRIAAASALAAILLAAPSAAETRHLSGFSAVAANDRLHVEVIEGAAYSVEVTGADAGRVRTRVEGRTLHVADARRPWFGSPRLDAHVRVTAPSLGRVAAARGASLTAVLSGACGAFSAAAAMGGSTRVAGVDCENVNASAAMGGEVELQGACGALSTSAAMGGFVRADALACQTVDASASMGGDIRASASQTYEAAAAMGGAVNVIGGASALDTSAVMGGSIRSQ